MVYITSSRLFYFITRSMYFDQLYPFHPFPPTQIACLWQPPICALYLWVWILFFRFHMYLWDHIVCVFLWLISLKIQPCCCKRQYFLRFMVKYHPLCLSPCGVGVSGCVCVCVRHISFIHSPSKGSLGCFHVLVTGNNAAVNMWVQVPFQVSVLVFLK